MKRLWTSASVRKLAMRRLQLERAGLDEDVAAPLDGPPSGKRPRPDREASNHETAPREDPYRIEWMWGRFEKSRGNRVLLAVPVDAPDAGKEMRLLCTTLGLEVLDVVNYSLRGRPSPATFIGQGTLSKWRESMGAQGAAAIVLDAPLSPSQMRNVEQELQSAVVDRQAVILAIFELHAKTKLAKMQVELARLKYLQPRLAGLWMGLSRQSGGKGGLGGRGLGETRLELDRRVVKDRIASLTKKLKESERAYATQSARRHGLPRVALVGYTNAGKSTLMHALTKSAVGIENKLFSTLDTTVRPLSPPTQPKILVSDTVGFVRELPHDLVASFRSTLQEALDGQLILHVVDVSHPQWREHIQTTETVLEEIGAGGIPKILILNKSDLVRGPLRMKQSDVARFLQNRGGYENRYLVSAAQGEGIADLRRSLVEYFGATEPRWSHEHER